MIVLSLCDGISVGQLALNKAGIAYSDYISSEIDPKAIKITQKNYPETIQVGDMNEIYFYRGSSFMYCEKRDVDVQGLNLGEKLLLLSGTPCQRLSNIGQGKGLKEETDNLFYKFIKIKNKANPDYFLFENTPTSKENIEIMNTLIGCEPIIVNSSLVSAQNRKRLYWTNIPFDIPEDRNIYLQDILLDGKAHRSKSKTVRVGGRGSKDRHEWDIANREGRTYNIIECERLQTLPDNYTQCDAVTETDRFRCVGNAWTADVIAHILKGLNDESK